MRWWNSYTIERGQWARWRIGPLVLFAQPRRREWVFAWQSCDDRLSDASTVDVPSLEEPNSDSCAFIRFAAREMPNYLTLEPRLGDRAFVVRPDSPLSLLAGEETVLYVRTAVWVAVTIANGGSEAVHNTLVDMPALRPSDTWFGPNTMEGELCYASRTRARTDLEAVGTQEHRAVTPIEISNLGTDTLSIDQLRVPVPALAVHADRDDRLWTDPVRFVRNEGEREAELSILETSEHLPMNRSQLSDPRRPIEAGTIVDAFSRFLG